jgi:hypothetical protein
VPLEFRGASGALDNEHEHRNLRTRGSHIKTDDLSRDVQPHPMTALTDEQSAALLAGWATARQHAFGRGKSKVLNVRITEAGRKAIRKLNEAITFVTMSSPGRTMDPGRAARGSAFRKATCGVLPASTSAVQGCRPAPEEKAPHEAGPS